MTDFTLSEVVLMWYKVMFAEQVDKEHLTCHVFFFVLFFFSNPSQNQSIRQIQSPLERRINIQTWSQAIVEQISYLLISVSQKRQAVTLFLCASSAVMCVCVCADYPKWV